MNVPEGYIGLCSICVTNLNASIRPYVGPEQQGFARDMLGEVLTIPKCGPLEWKKGEYIPPGFGWVAGIFLMLGEGVDLRWPGQQERIAGFATTMLYGTLVCDWHNDRQMFGDFRPPRYLR